MLSFNGNTRFEVPRTETSGLEKTAAYIHPRMYVIVLVWT